MNSCRRVQEKSTLVVLVALMASLGCASQPSANDARADAAIDASDGNRPPVSLVVAADKTTQHTGSWSVNYWQWMPDFGEHVSGTAFLVKALKPAFLRVGGYNNDINAGNPLDHAAFDKAVAYARAIGAEPIIQVPLLADTQGQPPTTLTSAEMVEHANVTMGYAIKYFSVGNEPDLYATQGLPANGQLPAIPGYLPADYCSAVRAHVNAMKAVDPSIRIVGPDLSWKYYGGGGDNDWLTPILSGCGDAFDVIAIHRYPFSAKQATLTAAAEDAASFRRVIARVREIMNATGHGGKPLALTEMNVVYDKTWCALEASPATVGSALWLADSVGTALELGLWTTAVWDISDSDAWALGLIGPAPAHVPRPSYYAYGLYADHFGPTLAEVTSMPDGVSAHASRSAAGDATQLVVVNWNNSRMTLPIEVTGLPSAIAASVSLPAHSMAAVEIPDNGPASAWVYGEAERQAGAGPRPLVAGDSAVVDAGLGQAAGRAIGAGCNTPAIPDASFVATADGGISSSCGAVVPEATGNLNITGSYVTTNNLHGYGAAWAWKGIPSQATICVAPLCTTSDGFGVHAVHALGAAPFSKQPISCSPALPTSALCAAGSMSRDPTYYSMVGIGFNLNEDATTGDVHGLAIAESITITTQLSGASKGNATLRLQLTDMEDNFYCVETGAWKSGIPTPLRSFRKQCWDPSVPDAEARPGTVARRVDVFLPGSLTDQDFAFCLLDVVAK